MNSWGTRWGENGFIRLARSQSVFHHGQCGIAIAASLPIGGKLLISLPTDNPEDPINEEEDNKDFSSNWFNKIEKWCLSNAQVCLLYSLISSLFDNLLFQSSYSVCSRILFMELLLF